MDDVVAGEETLSLAAHRDGLIELGERHRHLLRQTGTRERLWASAVAICSGTSERLVDLGLTAR